MLSGAIDWFDKELEQGFIKGDDQPDVPRVYFISQVIEGDLKNKIRAGLKVSYELDPATKNGPRASRVIIREDKNS